MEDVKVEFELTAAQALALAQFVKRVRWTEVRHERAAHSTKKLGLNNHRSWPNQFSSTGTGFSNFQRRNSHMLLWFRLPFEPFFEFLSFSELKISCASCQPSFR